MSVDIETFKEIWAQFMYEGKLDPRVQPPVADSWQKCRAAGVNPEGGHGTRVDPAVFQSILDANKTLIDTATPIMQSVFGIVKRSHFMAVYEAAQEAVARARAGKGPTLIECKTYRQHGHFEGDPATYKPKEEQAAWRTRWSYAAARWSYVQ